MSDDIHGVGAAALARSWRPLCCGGASEKMGSRPRSGSSNGLLEDVAGQQPDDGSDASLGKSYATNADLAACDIGFCRGSLQRLCTCEGEKKRSMHTHVRMNPHFPIIHRVQKLSLLAIDLISSFFDIFPLPSRCSGFSARHPSATPHAVTRLRPLIKPRVAISHSYTTIFYTQRTRNNCLPLPPNPLEKNAPRTASSYAYPGIGIRVRGSQDGS